MHAGRALRKPPNTCRSKTHAQHSRASGQHRAVAPCGVARPARQAALVPGGQLRRLRRRSGAEATAIEASGDHAFGAILSQHAAARARPPDRPASLRCDRGRAVRAAAFESCRLQRRFSRSTCCRKGDRGTCDVHVGSAHADIPPHFAARQTSSREALVRALAAATFPWPRRPPLRMARTPTRSQRGHPAASHRKIRATLTYRQSMRRCLTCAAGNLSGQGRGAEPAPLPCMQWSSHRLKPGCWLAHVQNV
eukprot:21691-Chlamydomonas_euryale.AAC.3